MALWTVNAQPWPIDTFAVVEPGDVLIEYDEPLTFTFLDALGNMMLAHACASNETVNRYVVAPTRPEIIDNLKTGGISIRGALDQTISWLVDVGNDQKVIACWVQRISDLPIGAVPAPDVLLHRHLSQEYKTTRFVRSESDGQIAFDGTPVHDHEINLGFYGRFLTLFQQLYDAVSTSIHGKVFGDIRGGVAVPSSYAIDLKIPTQESTPSMFGTDDRDATGARAAFEFVSTIMSGGRDAPETAAIITQFQEVRRRYGSVLELMSENGAAVVFRTRQFPTGRRMTNQDATLKFRSMKELGFPYGHIVLRGELVGSQIVKVGKHPTSFLLLIKGEVSYTGTIAVDAIEKVKQYFGDLIDAKMRVVDQGDRQQTYELLDVQPLPPRDVRSLQPGDRKLDV